MQQYPRFSLFIGSANGILMSKIYLPTTVTQCWTSPRNSVNWFKVVYGDMSINGLYPYCTLDTLYDIFHGGFTFSHTKFNATSWANLRLFFLKWGYNLIFKTIFWKKFTTKEKLRWKLTEHKITLDFLKKYNLGAPVICFIISSIFVEPGGN